MKLVIFDLDQTLVDFLPLHDQATQKLFRRFFGVDGRLTELDFAGKSLTENFAELARLKNVPEESFKHNSRRLLKAYEGIVSRSIPEDASRHVLPGARRLLDKLSRTDNLIVLYTGDSPGIVKRVTQTTGLGKYFRFFFSGTELPTRADMVGQAIRKAEKLAGKRFAGKDVVIIGDSIRDIDSGKQFNALTIAVATGLHSEQELLSHNPDYLFKSLEDDDAVLKAIG